MKSTFCLHTLGSTLLPLDAYALHWVPEQQGLELWTECPVDPAGRLQRKARLGTQASQELDRELGHTRLTREQSIRTRALAATPSL